MKLLTYILSFFHRPQREGLAHPERLSLETQAKILRFQIAATTRGAMR